MRRFILPCLALFLAACSGAGREELVAPVYPYAPDAAFAGKLRPCARQQGEQVSCRLEQLPLLAMQQSELDHAAVLGRLATSHDWMGERFAELLQRMPEEILPLMGSVSAIIIGSDVRPSFYWRHTGAIYLDPAGLWLSIEEKRSIDPAPDYRASFGKQLNFHIISRYVLNNRYAWYGYSLEDDSERSLEDILAPMTRLLYHELAHAADFFPPAVVNQLDPTMNYLQAAQWVSDQGLQPSQKLTASYPLQSETMYQIAQVKFFGREPSDAQLALRSEEVAGHFAADQANDDYNYSTRYEDLAMLFEELMMDFSFGIQRDVAVADRPAPGQEHIVTWGQRQRIAEQSLRPRVEQVAQDLLPQTNFSAYFAELGEPRELRSGATWNDNLDPQGGAKSSLRGLLQNNPRDLVVE